MPLHKPLLFLPAQLCSSPYYRFKPIPAFNWAVGQRGGHRFVSCLVTTCISGHLLTDPLTDGKLGGHWEGSEEGQDPMAMGSEEEAAAPKFYKHTAVFPGFLFLGVWPPSNCSFVPAIFLQDAGKGEGILCLCPRAVTLGRVRGQECSREEELGPCERKLSEESPAHTQVCTESEPIPGPCVVSGAKPAVPSTHSIPGICKTSSSSSRRFLPVPSGCIPVLPESRGMEEMIPTSPELMSHLPTKG